MSNLLLAFSTSLFADLSDRPGRNKFEKEKASVPRRQMQLVLERLAREMARCRTNAHLRADVLEEPLHIRRLYKPGEFGMLLSSFHVLARMPSGSSFAARQPHGYVACFQYRRIGWTVLTAYLETDIRPVLVFLRAQEDQIVISLFNGAASNHVFFDDCFRAAIDVTSDALDT